MGTRLIPATVRAWLSRALVLVLATAGLGLASASPASATGTLGWSLSNWFGGTGDVMCAFGEHGDQIVSGDWDGDGTDGPGVFRNGTWYLANYCGGPIVVNVGYGETGDVAVVGDWDGNGTDTLGIWRQGTWALSNDFSTAVHHVFGYGTPPDVPVVGDWDGDGKDSVGVFRNGTWSLADTLGAWPNHVFIYGETGDVPLVGDWNSDGKDTPIVRRGITWYVTNQLGAAPAQGSFIYGPSTDRPIVGDWDGNGTDTPGAVSSSVEAMDAKLRQSAASGSAEGAASLRAWEGLSAAQRLEVATAASNPELFQFFQSGTTARASLDRISPNLQATTEISPRGTSYRYAWWKHRYHMFGVTISWVKLYMDYAVSGNSVSRVLACTATSANYSPSRELSRVGDPSTWVASGKGFCRATWRLTYISLPNTQPVHREFNQTLVANSEGIADKYFS